MNEVMKNLLNRRSIRAYKPEQIKDEELMAVLEAGMYAPTGGNQQTPVFIAVQNPEDVKALGEMNTKIAGAAKDMFYGAPTVILVLADKTKGTPVEDGSLALGNMFNAAASLGLGSCWINRVKEMFESDEGKAFLKKWNVPGDLIGVGACILGYPACDWPAAAPRKEGYYYIIK